MARTSTWLVNETIVRTAIVVVVGAIVSGLGSGSAIALDGSIPDTLQIDDSFPDPGINSFQTCHIPCKFNITKETLVNESYTVTGTLSTADIAQQITPGTYNVLLTEGPPGLTTPISDIFTLTAGPTTGPDHPNFTQDITITFTSDAEIVVPDTLTCATTATTVCLTETGQFQDMFGFTGSYDPTGASALLFQVASDAPEAVPEPSTLLLLGSGLAGLAAWRRRQAA